MAKVVYLAAMYLAIALTDLVRGYSMEIVMTIAQISLPRSQ